MDINREQLLREIMAADFQVIELNLYLDTHPNDQRALMIFSQSSQRAMMLRHQYERMYGPITPMTTNPGYPWKWIEDPWPWERV